MYNNISFFLWMILCFIILVCELYVPYKNRFFFSIASGAFASSFLSFFLFDLFRECVFFISASALIYIFSSFKVAVKKRKTGMLSVIALCDIEEDSYGKVYYMVKVYIIKNPECQNIKKGEVVRIEKRRLEGERLVPERI